MRKRATSIALAGLLALAACSGTTGATTSEALTDTTLAGTSGGTEASSDALAAVAAFQEDIQALSDAISESESAEELRSAWDTLNAELTESVESVREDGSIAREEIEASLMSSSSSWTRSRSARTLAPHGTSFAPTSSS